MSPWLLAAAGVAAGWLAYGSLYALWAQSRWPPQGRRVRVSGGRLHVVESGTGASVLCLHGASANAREWDALRGALGDDLRVLAMDRPGHGHSSRLRGRHRLKVQARAAADLLEAMRAAPAIVVAHSLGCATALRLALDRPDLVRALVLCAPASHPYPGANPWHTRLAATPILGWLFTRLAVPLAAPLASAGAVRNTFRPAAAPANYAREAGLGLLFRPETFRGNALEVRATKAEFEAQYWRYDEIEVPAIVITADADAVLSPRIHAQALARTLPKGELVVVPGVGHMPHRLRPQALAAAVRRLAGMDAGEPVEG